MKSLFDCYSRLLIDNHITDHKPEYMEKFSPAEYVRMVRIAGVESAMVYACDHNGNCYYPSSAGYIHSGCKGRDLFGETAGLLKKSGIVPIAYYTVIYHNHSTLEHPEWRMCGSNGTESHRRYRFSCPSHPEYVEFSKRQIAEILEYPIGGIFIDMTFWPQVCVCPSCQEKYGRPIPEIIDWTNPEWVHFQRWRESTMATFGAELTAFVKSIRPEITVTHQFSPVLHGWFLGQSAGIAEASDYASGDFYGGALQQRLGCKVFAAFTKHPPYEFMTSRCESLRDHTSTKSDEELFLHAATTLANGGAYFFIDAINPDGTLEEKFYRRLRGIVQRLEPFKKVIAHHRPELYAETGVYFSMKSCVQEEKNGLPLTRLHEDSNNMGVRNTTLLEELLGCADLLNTLHIPYRIVTETDTDLSAFKALIVNHAIYMTPEETERIRRFVAEGGLLIATGKSSLFGGNGEFNGNFQLADVFGVDYSGINAAEVSYLATGEDLISCSGLSYPLVLPRKNTKVLGYVALPDFPVNDPNHYASIHSNPPGRVTAYGGWTEHIFGKGRAIYLYSGFLRHRQHSQREFGRKIFASLPQMYPMISGVHPTTELTVLKGNDNTWILTVVNYQDRLPNLPLRNVKIGLCLPDILEVNNVRRASDEANHPFCCRNGLLELNIHELHDLEFFVIEGK